MDSLEKAKAVVEAKEGWPPMTDDPYFNFLLDVAHQELAESNQLSAEDYNLSDWKAVQGDYEREVEAYKEEGIELYEAQELFGEVSEHSLS